MISIDIRGDLKPLQKAFIGLRAKQVPFATSLAVNNLAKGVVQAERALIDHTFETPTPFTENAYRIEVATKGRPIAIVAAKDIQAEYLEPYVDGGPRFLGDKKAMLAPRAVRVNQYGNLPRGKLQSLKGRKDIFVGPVHTKSGKVINGVWQRTVRSSAGSRRRNAGTAAASPLKLLIRFEDTTPVRKKLQFYPVAREYVRRNAAAVFNEAMKRALATAR